MHLSLLLPTIALPVLVGLTASCGEVTEPSVGTLLITVATTGASHDPDGYTFKLDDGSPEPVSVNAAVERPGLAAGSHLLLLDGLAGNCHLEGQNPRPVTVPSRGTITVAFQVTCHEDRGTIRITAATSGVDQDPDGYLVAVGGASQRVVLANGTVTVPAATGTVQVGLDGLAPNCTLQGENPRQAIVAPESIVELAFTIDCAVVRGSRILFVSERSGALGLYTVHPDGTQLRTLTSGESQYVASWSPDGSRIAFGSWSDAEGFRISLMNADGSGRSALTRASWGVPPAWSPDRRTIAILDVDAGPSIDPQIYLVATDGGPRRQLTHGSGIEVSRPPRWSLDGTRILFARGYGSNRIFTITVDGSREDTLTAPGPLQYDADPQWSPDGSRIAFVRGQYDPVSESAIANLWVMNADGTDPRNLTGFSIDESWGSVTRFSWDRGGNGLVFARGEEIFRVQAEGGAVTRLYDDIAEGPPLWSPDGSRILFTRWLGSQYDLFVMSPAGGALTNITGNPGYDGGATWQP